MTLEQLKERIEATCMKHGFEAIKLYVASIGGISVYCSFNIKAQSYFYLSAPDIELLLERVDWECKVIKAYQSRASNGIDE